MPHPAIFIDRDGTLMEEVHYCNDPAKVCLLRRVPQGLRALRNAGFKTILITNQGGIGKGLISLSEYESVHARLLELLGPNTLDASYMCADASGAPSSRRKPAPGMIFEAAAAWELDLTRSWVIGDKDIDIECGRNAGLQAVLVRTGHGRQASGSGASHVAADFSDAVDWILAGLRDGTRPAPPEGSP